MFTTSLVVGHENNHQGNTEHAVEIKADYIYIYNVNMNRIIIYIDVIN